MTACRIGSSALGYILWFIMLVATGFCQSPDGLPKPPKPLRERLLQRALHGDPEAQFDLGRGYETGRIGLPQDLSEAHRWYREAADQGDPFAEASLGMLFDFGKGGERDYVQAYIWYERAVLRLSGGDRETVSEMRDRVAAKLSSQQVAEARSLAEKWKPTPRKSLVQ